MKPPSDSPAPLAGTRSLESLRALLGLAEALQRAETPEEVVEHALESLSAALGVSRASVLLFDESGVMRFKAWRGLSEDYRRAVEGHSPWRPDSLDARPILVADAAAGEELGTYRPTILAEGIRALAFVPLVDQGRVLGKFMLYHDEPHTFSAEEVDLATAIAGHVAFSVARRRADIERAALLERAVDSEDRYRALFTGLADAVLVADAKSRYIDANAAAETLLGRSREAILGLRVEDVVTWPPERTRAEYGGFLANGTWTGEVEIRRPDGSTVAVEARATAVHLPGGMAYLSVLRDITERRRAASEIERLYREASAANRAKDEFLATASHELRTPLNAILGWASLLRNGQVEGEAAARAIATIERNARAQAELIDEILDVSRIVTGKLRIERAPLELAAVVRSALETVEPEAEARAIRVELRLDPGDAAARG